LEFRQKPVACGFDDTPVVFFNAWQDVFFQLIVQTLQNTQFVNLHQSALTDNIGHQNCRKPSFHRQFHLFAVQPIKCRLEWHLRS